MKPKTITTLTALLFCSAVFAANPAWKEISSQSSSTEDLRGFGKCTVTGTIQSDGKDQVSIQTFRTKSDEKAALTAGKFIYDLQCSYGMQKKIVKIGNENVFIFVTPSGSAFCVTVNAVTASIFAAPNEKVLTSFLKSNPSLASGSTDKMDFPEYMKYFAWGTYGMGGFENFHGWMQKTKKNSKDKDPVEDFDFLVQMKHMYFDNWLQPVSMDNADGIMYNNGYRWKRKLAEQLGIPYSNRFYVNAGGFDWTGRRFSEYIDRPADFMINGWLRYSEPSFHYTWYAPEIHRYIAVKSMDIMKANMTPKTRGWMHPHGELVHQPWYDMHADYSTYAQKSWHDYLTANKISIAEVSKMYCREDNPFQTMEQVPVPEFATFAGLPKQILSLKGTWYHKTDVGNPAGMDAAWWKQPLNERYPGLKEKWYLPETDLSDWGTIEMPGTKQFTALYREKGMNQYSAARWYRRSFDYKADTLKGERVYLYFFPMTNGGLYADGKIKKIGDEIVDTRQFNQIYINGKHVSQMGSWAGLDVTDFLKKGTNTIAIQLHGVWWNGRIFLSTEKPGVYPYLTPERNKLWILWCNWRRETKYKACAEILDGMRQVDPNRPIKFMAPLRFGFPITNKLARDYGIWGHFTGEGAWFFPWYKRYGKFMGFPATSELAGPNESVVQTKQGSLRVFLAGLDGHQPVFLTQTYSRNPEIRKWWLDHKDMLERVGKYDIYGPQVIIYRRSLASGEDYAPRPEPAIGASAAKVQLSWDWDIGRGSLQTIGQSYLYMDDDGLADGRAYEYPFVIDGGNETIPDDSIKDLEKYVKNGGIYMTLPFSGRHSTLEPNKWGIQNLTGCKILGTRKPGGKIIFEKNIPYLQDYAGKTIIDNGESINCNGNNENEYSVELEPGKDCTVIARYENGKAAIVARKLGKGTVLAFGTAFWRDARDINGIWWPGKKETDFLSSLLKSINFPNALCTTDDYLVWPQPYRSHNGLDSVTVLTNFNKEGTQTPTVSLRLEQKPVKIVTYGGDGTKEVPFTWKNGIAKVKINIDAQEIKIIEAEAYSSADALAYWWKESQERWYALKKPSIDFAPYSEGKWKDPTQDLSFDACFTNDKPKGDWTAADFDDSKWTKSPLDIFYFWGAKPNTKLYARKKFDVDRKWLESGEIRLISGAWNGRQYMTPVRIILNGTEIQKFDAPKYKEFEVSKLLKAKDNILAFEMKDGHKYIGIVGNVYLYHKDVPAESYDLSGTWHMPDGKTGILPGHYKNVKYAKRTVMIPAAWKDKYKVFLYISQSGNKVATSVKINGRHHRRHHHAFGDIMNIDITNLLKFGEDNEIQLDPKWQFIAAEEIHLDLYPLK